MATLPTNDSSDREEKDSGVNKLVVEIQAAVKAKDFPLADSLREKLIQTDSTALKEIIDSAEMIDKAKEDNIDREHLAIWDGLYSTLSQGERNCLFYSMEKIVIPPKKIILSHGAYNSRLFFIDGGKVTIVFPRKGKNTVLAQLGKGHLLGEYSFTSISLCSATAVSHTDVKLYCLDNKITDSWQEEFPGLREKIVDYCVKNGSLEDIARWKSLEKRDKPRYQVSEPLKGYLLDKAGKQTDTYFSGTLSDISVEGCAFEIKLSKKATARALLARNLHLGFTFDVGGKPLEFSTTGQVVKVSYFMYNDYCVHIKFANALKKSVLARILKKNK